MGLKGWDFIRWKLGHLDDISPQVIAVDAPNYITRRISSFTHRQRILSERIPTTHIHVALGLIRMALKNNIVPVFIFDGPPETLKRPPNPKLVREAGELYSRFHDNSDLYDGEIALRLYESPPLRWYFSVLHIKNLCLATGVPALTAASEAEMTAAVMCRDKIAGTVLSNDADALLFGSPHVTKAIRFSKSEVEYSILDEMMATTELELEQLRDLAILCGCDFHKGIKGIGPRKGMVLLKRFGNLEDILKYLGFDSLQREEYIKSRETFDEPNYISLNGINPCLNAPMISKLDAMLSLILGIEQAEQTCKEIVKLWKNFGSYQATLEAWF